MTVRARVIDHLPRVHEIMYLFGIFRATRVTADIGIQLNEVNIQETADHMRAGSPWLDDDVARVDAEIYLRRPPGYGLGYTIGNLQIQQLPAEGALRAGLIRLEPDAPRRLVRKGVARRPGPDPV